MSAAKGASAASPRTGRVDAAGPRVTRAILHAQAREALERAGVESAADEAEALMLHALSIRRAELWANPDDLVGEAAAARFLGLIESRARRIPLQHLIGEVPFHHATIIVEPGVFIPRPETEQLVERALEELRATAQGPGAGARVGCPERGTILELGVGTGAISIALLLALPPGWVALAIDRSEAACALAMRNAERNGVGGRLAVSLADFHDAERATLALRQAREVAWPSRGSEPEPRAAGPVDLLVSNPPYIPSATLATLMPEVRDHDPREALDGGPDGLDSLRAVARGLPAWLKPGGILALEIGEDQADASLELFQPLLEGARVSRDLAGRPRVLIGRTRG